jgi:hypothetical protein
MSVAERLNGARDEFSGCEVLAFADLSTGLVLCSSSVRKRPQEWFDQMCQAAIDLLDGEFARQASGLLTAEGAVEVRQAIQVVDGELRLFLRSESAPSEALCCVCATDAPVDDLAAHARVLLREISMSEANR